MSESFQVRQSIRKSFEKVSTIIPLPDLIELQKKSYARFLQTDINADQRENTGIQAVWNTVFPIKDFAGKAQIEFLKYHLDHPKYEIEECLHRGLTYASPLRVTFRLIVWDVSLDSGARSVRDIKEQEVYVGDIPLMTPNGTFVVNGVERVIVSQMHRSPGVFFDHDHGKTHASGKFLFNARVIPYRGSWIDFEFDGKDILYVRIDRRRKLPVTTLLMALDSEETAKKRAKAGKNMRTPSTELNFPVNGMSLEEILKTFYKTLTYEKHEKGWKVPFYPEEWRTKKLARDLIDAHTGKVILKTNEKITPRKARKIKEEGLSYVLVPQDDLLNRYLARGYTQAEEVFGKAGEQISDSFLEKLETFGYQSVDVLDIDMIKVGPYLRNTLFLDRNTNRETALIDMYRVLRPGEPPTLENAESLFIGLFFDPDRYDLSDVGRVKMNARLELKDKDDVSRILSKEDILAIVRVLLRLKDGHGTIDDIDNLSNRRVRSVGELLENHYQVGLLRLERTVRERMSAIDIDSMMPNDLINSKPASASIKEFFASSQLSQFMAQTNPLTEITHKRRLSALGPGGLTRDRATFEVRDVHPTHYGRICPIETPEGQNIGLINSLASYARINKYGFIETPCRKVRDGVLTNEVTYISAMEEWKYTIAQATAPIDKNEKLTEEFVLTRKAGEICSSLAKDVDYIDVSPKQLVSVAASLIPFLENNDANRALMGSNMQRQAVPLLKTEAPLIGTGMEKIVAYDSGVVIKADRSGVVSQVDGTRIVVRSETSDVNTPGVDIYTLRKFQKTNQNTCFNQKPLVRVGDHVESGDVIADGPSTANGELALGRNVLLAFLSWHGYNFEDAIIISEHVVQNDDFTSIHIEEFDIMARDTKLGQEEISRDIPNVGDEALRHLDEAGIVSIGAEVHPGDILVGKVTPKGESPTTPEEKLLRAIFGEKASDMRDTSLRLPPGSVGTVVNVRIFSRRGIDKDERSLAIEQEQIERLSQDHHAKRTILEDAFYDQLKKILAGQEVYSGPKKITKGSLVDDTMLKELTVSQWRQLTVKDKIVMNRIESLKSYIDQSIAELQTSLENKIEKVRLGDDLSPGVLKMVKVFVAVKRKLSLGDKMAGRHGNKGVVARIVPVEDMPYLEDGTPVDMILNPLGLPSRMNVGQILETHLGWAAAGLGKQIDAAIQEYLSEKTNLKALKKFLTGMYADATTQKTIQALDKKDLLYLAKKLSSGVPMATPVFNGAKEPDVTKELKHAGMDTSGQEILYDGQTGEPFDRPVTIGYKYMLKLHHLVDDKIHARSIGPYSLVTQQPLGGKAQFGGQRFGEMEVWGLEAYGAAYTLQEMLTFKSDDIAGRTNVYSAIVRGDNTFHAGVPESFNVLTKELRALGLNMNLNENVKS